jgi:lariat debranching enzyme
VPAPISDGREVESVLTYDPVWLAITRAFHPFLSLSRNQTPLPIDPSIAKAMVEREMEWVKQNVKDAWRAKISDVQQFVQTAPAGPDLGRGARKSPSLFIFTFRFFATDMLFSFASLASWYTNPQTEAFCAMLGIENKINPAPPELGADAAMQEGDAEKLIG